jgi:hypothetical protein
LDIEKKNQIANHKEANKKTLKKWQKHHETAKSYQHLQCIRRKRSLAMLSDSRFAFGLHFNLFLSDYYDTI